MKKAFISYVKENRKIACQIVSYLRNHGVEVWFDRDSLLPGEHWKDKIRQAIKNGDYFIACFSPEYIGRTTTYMNEELNVAIEELRLKQDSSEWFIPISIDSCKIPEIQIRSGLYLSDIQFMDLSKDADKGLHSIVKTIGVDGFHEIKQQLESLSKYIEKKRLSASPDFAYKWIDKYNDLLKECKIKYGVIYDPYSKG